MLAGVVAFNRETDVERLDYQLMMRGTPVLRMCAFICFGLNSGKQADKELCTVPRCHIWK